MLYAIVGMLAIILDQAVKFWVTSHIMVDTIIQPLIPGVLSLVRVHNDGAAFSFLAGGGARIYFIILAVAFVVAVILALATNFINGKLGRWCLVMVAAGGLSNCLDRILYGYVVDMFRVELFNFAVFNVADIFITVFCLIFIVYIIFGGESKKKEVPDEFDMEDDYSDVEDASQIKDQVKASVKESRAEKKAAKLKEKEAQRPKRSKREVQEADLNELRPQRKAPSSREDPDRKAPRQQSEPVRKAPRQQSEPVQRPAQRQRPQAGPMPDSSVQNKARPNRPVADAPQTRKPQAPVNSDPFAEWEKANAKVEQQQLNSRTAQEMGVQRQTADNPFAVKPDAPLNAPPVEAPKAPAVPKAPVAPKVDAPKPADDLDFSLDDILNEFK